MRYVLAIALILASAVGLAWYRSSTLQAGLVEAVEAALVAADAEEVLVSVDGLEVTLAGEVSDLQTKERLDRAVAQLPKIGRFVNAVEVASNADSESAKDAGGEASAADGGELVGAVVDGSAEASEPSGVVADATSVVSSPAGCQTQLNEILSRGSIDFGSSSAELEPASMPLLEELVATLARCGEERIEIAGHTDASGPREDNLELSLRRAEAVKAYLLAGDVNPERLTAIGYGPDVPLANNATPEGRAQNRRIELKVLSP